MREARSLDRKLGVPARGGAALAVSVQGRPAKTDMDLVQRLKRDPSREGDFRQLYERYAPATFIYFLRKVGDGAAAADLNQELFLRLARSIDGFEGRCSWRTWVFLIARTVLAEERGKRWSRVADRTVSLDARRAEMLELRLDADEEAAGVLLRARLRRCIRRLSDVARAVVLGHYFDGVTLRELTDRLRLRNPSGSRGVLIGAQRKLRRCMEEVGDR